MSSTDLPGDSDLPVAAVAGEDQPVTQSVPAEIEQSLLPIRSVQIPYSADIARAVTDLYAEGHSVAKISAMEGMPAVASIYRWRRDNADFREALNAARESRAFSAEEAIAELAEKAEGLHKDDVAGHRLAFDAHSWRAGVNDPEKYGKRTTIQGDQSRPIIFNVVSHIPAPEKPVLVAVRDVVTPAVDEPPTPEPEDEGPNAA